MGLLDDAIREHLDLKRRRGADPTEVERSEREALGPVRRAPERVPGDDTELEPDAGFEAGPVPGAVYDEGLVDADEPGAAAFAPGGPDLREPVAAADERPDPPPGRLDHSTLPGPAGSDDDEPSWSYDESAAAAEPDVRIHDEALPPRSDEALPPRSDEAVPPPHRADSMPLEGDADHTAEYDVAAALGADEPPSAGVEPEDPHGTHPAPPHEHDHGAPSDEDEDVLEETPEFLQDTPDHDRLWFEQRPPKDFDFDG